MTKILIVGHKGQLGRLLYEFPTDFEHVGWDLPEMDITDGMAVVDAMEALEPQVVINAAAYTNVDAAESEPEMVYAVNTHAVGHLARGCCRLEIPFVHISTNEVFDGTSAKPYDEWDQPHAISTYARSKVAGERAARFYNDKTMIVRLAWLFASGGNNFPKKIVDAADKLGELHVVGDEFGNPTYAPHAVWAIYGLIGRSAPFGIYHLTNSGYTSRYEFAREVLAQSGRSHVPIHAIPVATWPRPSRPPMHAILANRAAAALGIELAPWREAVAEWAREEGWRD